MRNIIGHNSEGIDGLRVWEAIATLHNYRIGVRPLAKAMALGMCAGKEVVREAMRQAALHGQQAIQFTDAELEEPYPRERFQRVFTLIRDNPKEWERLAKEHAAELQTWN